MRRAYLLAFVLVLAALATPCPAEFKPKTLPKPLRVKVTLASSFEAVAGDLLRYDADAIVLKTDKGDRSIKWAALTRLSHYGLRKQLVDPNNPADWRDLAELATKLGMTEEAVAARERASAGDPLQQVKRDIAPSRTTATSRPSTAPTTQRMSKPMTVTVMLSDESTKLTGELVAFDKDYLLLKTSKGEQALKWTYLTPLNRYQLRAQLVDKSRAADWLDLAEVAMKCNLPGQAQVAIANATRIDPASRLKGDAIVRAYASSGPVKYQKATPQEHAQAIEFSRDIAKAVSESMGMTFGETQSTHFIIFTDWPSGEHDFLCRQCEDAYAAVSKQFDIPVEENVFVGKLLVFTFAKREDYNRFATTIDHLPGDSIKDVAGYFKPHLDGTGHMAMPHPQTPVGSARADTEWSHTLTHEFTHAFVARYRTNRPIPRWLHEGIAEWVAYQRFPRKDTHKIARILADYKLDFVSLFDDTKYPGGEMYPVMQTMVEALINDDRRAFIKMFNDIKDGVKPEDALWRNYHATYKDWEPAWRNYARRLKD